MVSLLEEFDVEVDWRGYFLHPEIPEGGISVETLLGTTSTREFTDYLDRFASSFEVQIRVPSHIPNTRRALLMTEYARDQSKLEAFRDATMEAYWLKGDNIEDDSVLSPIAEFAGLDPILALAALENPKYSERIETDLKEARERKVTGIPTLFIQNKMIVGCHSYADLEKAAKKAGLEWR